jgi:hypothetical protein
MIFYDPFHSVYYGAQNSGGPLLTLNGKVVGVK